MIYNLSTILRETMKQANKKEKEKDICLDMVRKPIYFSHNLKIDIELANRKSIELYKKYNTNTSIVPVSVPKFSILDLNKDPNKKLVETKYNKTGLTICSICVFAFLAYSYFKKK
jgi:hypothetical protein